MEKNRVLNHSPSLFDVQGTEAFALEQEVGNKKKCSYLLYDFTQAKPMLTRNWHTVHNEMA